MMSNSLAYIIFKLFPQDRLMASFHILGVGNGFYLRESSQQIQPGKGLCVTSAHHPSPSKEELPATAAPLSLLVPFSLFRCLHDPENLSRKAYRDS